MFVSDVRPSDDIYRYNSIKLNVLRREMIEADRSVSKREVAKAVSDIAKDFTLQQYQYFIGKSNAMKQGELVFRTGESFAL